MKPSTRYYGSKRKLIDRILENIEDSGVRFGSVLDLFGGSGVFSYVMKCRNKSVMYNDLFAFNFEIGKALIENSSTLVSENDINYLLVKHSEVFYKYLISENFDGIYYPSDENEIIDVVVNNILQIEDNIKRACLFYILIQSCLIKRPFNLFHRSNLSIRTRDVPRKFGNKKTWEIPFKDLFTRFRIELNRSVFDNGKSNTSHNYSALECPLRADLVYVDPPYVSMHSHVTYNARYHFLEALVNYDNFVSYIDNSRRNREVQIVSNSDFESRHTIFANLCNIFDLHDQSFIAFSYRNGGVPSIDDLDNYLQNAHRVFNKYTLQHGYALRKWDSSIMEYFYIIYPNK